MSSGKAKLTASDTPDRKTFRSIMACQFIFISVWITSYLVQGNATLGSIINFQTLHNHAFGIPLTCCGHNQSRSMYPKIPRTSLMGTTWQLLHSNNIRDVILITDYTFEDVGFTSVLSVCCSNFLSRDLSSFLSSQRMQLLVTVVINCDVTEVLPVMNMVLYQMSHGHPSLLARPVINWVLVEEQGQPLPSSVSSVLQNPDTLIIVKSAHTPVRHGVKAARNICLFKYSKTGVAFEQRQCENTQKIKLPNTFQGFAGQHFIIGIKPLSPMVLEQEAECSQGLCYHGYAIDVLKEVANVYNFTFSQMLPPDGKWGGIDGTTGQWNGLIKMLQSGIADLVASSLTITWERAQVVDFTSPFYHGGRSLIVSVHTDLKFRIFQSLAPEVWTAYISSTVLGILCLWVIHHVQEKYKKPGGQQVQQLPTSVLAVYILGIIWGQGGTHKAKYTSSRIVISCFWILMLVMMATFSGNLVASLSSKKVKLPFLSLEEFARQDEYKLLLWKDTSHHTTLQMATDGLFHEMWKKMDPQRHLLTSMEETLQALEQGKFATMFDRVTAEIISSTSTTCQVRILPDIFAPSGYGLALSKDSPYTEIFSDTIRNILEAGLDNFWRRKYWPEDRCAEQFRPTARANAINLERVYGLLMILGGAVILASVILILEICVTNIIRWKATGDKQKAVKSSSRSRSLLERL